MTVLVGEKWIHGGRTLARLDGKVVFVEGLIPGERAEVKITKEGKGFSEAEVSAILTASPSRRLPKCRHAHECGGCQWQHVEYSEQLNAKTEILRDLFYRQGRIELPQNLIVEHGPEWEYRRRARMVQAGESWGYRKAKSHEVLIPQECPVLLQDLAEQVCQQKLNQKHHGSRAPEYQLLAGETIGIAQVFSKSRLSPQGQARAEAKTKTKESPDTAELQVSVGPKCIHAHAGSFFQSNAPLLDRFVQYIIEQCGSGKEAVELFSGVGFFTAWLQDAFQKVYSVERDPLCLWLAKKNTDSSKVKFVREDATRWLGNHASSAKAPDLLLVDPPRTGLDKKLIQSLVKLLPRRIVYVSCDPATQARDVRLLCESGYRFRSVRGFDLYPQTYHIESVVVLER